MEFCFFQHLYIKTFIMKLKNIFLTVLIALSFIATAVTFNNFRKSNGVLLFPKGSTYAKEWKRVDSLESKGLTKSALEVVQAIYNKAKAENNASQFIKAIIHRMKFEQSMEEYSLERALNKLNEEVKEAKYPVKPVLQSMLAESYWQYYQNNRWKFYERSKITTFKNDDIATWDLKTLFERVIRNYEASLENADSLKSTPLNIYNDILVIAQPESRKYRPTLYDFLAHRAVDFYMNEEPDLIRPAYKFELADSSAFEPSDNFIKIKFESKDSFSLKLHAIKILQELIAFHVKDQNPKAVIDADLKRLSFVRTKSVLEVKDDLYLKALKDLENKFTGDPASAVVNYEIARFYFEKGIKYDPHLLEENKWFKKQALELCEAVIKKYPGSEGAINCNVLATQIKDRSIDFITEKVNLPNEPFRTLVTYKNLKTVYVRIAKMEINKYTKAVERHYGKELIEQYLKLAPVKEWTTELPDDGDYQMHSTEMRIPELPLGHYIILIGSDKSFSYKNNGVAYAHTWISTISYVNRRMTNGSYDFYLQHRSTGEPLKGVIAQLYYEKYNNTIRKYEYYRSEKFISDEHGYFNVPPTEEYRNFAIDFSYTVPSKEVDHLQTDNGIYQYRTYPSGQQKLPQTFFFLDRGIYRPGQTVYFKGIMINTDGETSEIMPNAATIVTFYDVNQQKVADLNLTTNEYGTFTGSFTTPVALLNGQMSLSNGSGSISFSVEEYKRPKFEVLFNPIKGSYRLNDTIKVEGIAKAYSAANIDGAEVKYRVIRNVSLPHWWRGFHPQARQVEIATGVTSTNDIGTFFINFKAIPDLGVSKSYQPTYSYTVYADVTDINGETHSSQTYINAAYTSLNLNVDIPAMLEKENKKSFAISTTNMSGQFANAQGKVEIYKLKEPEKAYRKRLWDQPDKFIITETEFKRLFPNDEYKDENNMYKWPREEKVFEKAFNNVKQDSIKITNLRSWQQGTYVLEAHSTDEYGADVKDIKYFTVFSEKGASLPGNRSSWFVKIKEFTEPGEKAKFLIGSSEKSVRVLYETEYKGEVVKKEFITLNSEQKIIEIPIEEKHRGNFAVHFLTVKNNRIYAEKAIITVPLANKELDISFETFRDKLIPGQNEEWRIKIKDKKGEKLAAEMMATLYDASLDSFQPNDWSFNIYKNYYSNFNWEVNNAFGIVNAELFGIDWNKHPQGVYRYYDQLNWFGYGNGRYYEREFAYNEESNGASGNALYSRLRMAASTPAAEGKKSKETETTTQANASFKDEGMIQPKQAEKAVDFSVISARSNFSETAFFYPQLQTDKDGNVIIKFTIPEALTRWKMMGFAHTKDLKSGQIEKVLVTQKELMVIPNAPRFFRENDKMEFSAKISNLSEKELTGNAQLFFYDATSMKDITPLLSKESKAVTFIAKKGQSAVVNWNISIPEGLGAITYKVVAKAGNFTDGEEMVIPVLTNRMLVTETLPLSVRGDQTKTFRFEKLISQNNSSTTLRNHKLTLEFTSNPAWYAVQALPYLMEFPYQCSEQEFSRFYANSIASHIANSSPKIKAVFDSWKNNSGGTALVSSLEKNQELKSLMLEEMPWVMEAKDETERKKRIGLLFDLNKMSNESMISLKKLQQQQLTNGAWPWFEGMPDDRYITQHIITGMGHLKHLGIKNIGEDANVLNMINNGLKYLDDRIREDHEWIIKHNKAHLNDNHLSYLQIQYLYARSYFKDIKIDQRNQKAFDYYKAQAKRYWLKNNRYMQGMIALTLSRYDDKNTAKDIIRSLKETSLNNEEMGMYWKENYEGYYWYQAPIESQALLIEAFDEIANDKKSVDDMKVWLLRSKQTQNWRTTKATTEAIYALLLRGSDWLATEGNVEIKVGSNPLSLGASRSEVGTGYFKTSWNGSEIKPNMGEITVVKKDEGVSWGAMYWQYFEQLDKITSSKTPLNLKKQLVLQKNTDAGPVIEPVSEKTMLKVGDKLKVRIELRVDRDMEYVHMKDMRASGLEAINVISSYKWQDGLGYYESTRDAATNFFFSYLPKGTYVFEYPLVISHNGNFSNGITSIQCMYAPEFTSNSEGVRVKIGK